MCVIVPFICTAASHRSNGLPMVSSMPYSVSIYQLWWTCHSEQLIRNHSLCPSDSKAHAICYSFLYAFRAHPDVSLRWVE